MQMHYAFMHASVYLQVLSYFIPTLVSVYLNNVPWVSNSCSLNKHRHFGLVQVASQDKY